jgi:hypothetical protein
MQHKKRALQSKKRGTLGNKKSSEELTGPKISSLQILNAHSNGSVDLSGQALFLNSANPDSSWCYKSSLSNIHRRLLSLRMKKIIKLNSKGAQINTWSFTPRPFL